jgi:putative transposase
VPIRRVDEDGLTGVIIALAGRYGRYGYRRITTMVNEAGWQVGKDRVQRIWRREGLKVPAKQRPRGRLWLNDGSCLRLRPQRANHVWSYDFVSAMTHDGRALRLLTLIDEYTRECLAIRVARRLGRYEVIETLAEVMEQRGVPEHIRSDNGPEFIAQELRRWLAHVGTATLYIEPGSPWENGYCESFNGKLRDECLNGEIFYSLKEAQIVIEQWRVEYNTVRPHSALGYRPPAPQTGRPGENSTLGSGQCHINPSHSAWYKISARSMVLVEMKVKPEAVNEVKGLLKQMLPDTRGYAGCQGIDIYDNVDDTGDLVFYQRWDTRDHYQRYVAWRTETGVLDNLGAKLTGPPKIRYYDRVDV